MPPSWAINTYRKILKKLASELAMWQAEGAAIKVFWYFREVREVTLATLYSILQLTFLRYCTIPLVRPTTRT